MPHPKDGRARAGAFEHGPHPLPHDVPGRRPRPRLLHLPPGDRVAHLQTMLGAFMRDVYSTVSMMQTGAVTTGKSINVSQLSDLDLC